MTKFFVKENGSYIGGFDGAEPPSGAIEISDAPDDARQIWDFASQTWGAKPAAVVQSNRRAAYQSEADHLHLEEERGEVEAGTWLAKVNEIKARFPKA